MSLCADQLFALLPAVYRTRDAANGGPLQTLFAVMAAQSSIVENNIQQLYDDQFIETCAPWVIPYIGDLIGYNSIYGVAAGTDSRAEVANTIGYRRRKGTLVALEQLVTDVSGRGVVAVEEFRRLITTESMRLVRPDHDATVNMRRGRTLERLGGPFDVCNRTVDVRRIAPRVRDIADPDTAPLDITLHGPGRVNIPDIAIHLWRWQSWAIAAAPAFVVDTRRFMFSPLGNDTPLFPAPRARTAFTPTTRADVPQPIGRHELAGFYGPTGSILLRADGVAVDAEQVYGANLSDRSGGAWCTVAPGMIAIDPELGRIQYADDVAPPQSLQLSYSYGFPAPIAGGPYDRTESLSSLDPLGAHFFAVVGPGDFPTLQSAVTAWNTQPPGASGIIVLPGYASAEIALTGAAAIALPPGSSLAVVAGEPVTAGGAREVMWSNARATLSGDIDVAVGSPAVGDAAAPAGQLLLSGVWIAGQLRVRPADAAGGPGCTIQVVDCTLVPGLGLHTGGDPRCPGEPSIVVTAPATTLILNRVISGPVAADSSGITRICSSIIDATAPFYVAYAGADLASPGADLHVEDSTIIGKVRTRTFTLASNTIFHACQGRRDPWPAAIWASRRQAGCVRFCSLPSGSITPRRYRCLPPNTASEAALAPVFVTTRYGRPSYVMLSGDTPTAVWTGADHGSQIGAYLQVQETEAVSNVALRAAEYLPALLEAGIFLHPSRPRHEHRPPAIGYGYGYGPPCRRRPSDPLEELPENLPGIGANLI